MLAFTACRDAAPMPSVNRPSSALCAVLASCARPMGCRPYSGTTDVPTSERPAVSSAVDANATMGSTALAWEIHRLSNPAAAAYRATSRTSSIEARVVPPARPQRTPRRSPGPAAALSDGAAVISR